MAIKGLKAAQITAFTGKDTTTNLSAQAIGTLIAAKNCMVRADQNVRRVPGYDQLIAAAPGTGPVVAVFDFQRSVDQAQYIIIQRGTTLSASKVVNGVPQAPQAIPFFIGSGAFMVSGLTPAAHIVGPVLAPGVLTSPDPLEFIASTFICYATNGTDAIRLVDNAGVLTAYRWGLSQELSVPAVTPANGTATGLTYAWDFGDGTTASTVNPTHTYTTASYEAFNGSLAVTNSLGVSLSAKFTVAAWVSPSADNTPLAAANGPYYASPSDSVSFSAAGSAVSVTGATPMSGGAPIDSTLTFQWLLPDGGDSPKPVDGASPSKTYDKPGTYDAVLTVTNSLGNSALAFTTVIVRADGRLVPAVVPVSSSGTSATPTARTTGPYGGTVGSVISMSGAPSTDPNGSALTYSWNFSDGTTATGVGVSHAFSSAGTYVVSLTVTNAAGLSSTTTTQVRVQDNIPYLMFTAPASAQSGVPVQFDATASLNLFAITLTYGRNYVISPVSKYTDSLGIQRVHVGPPTPISPAAYTGPVNHGVTTLSFPASTDPQVTHQWIFATLDAPQNASATYFFVAEVPNSQTTFTDDYFDTEFDQTRLAPFGNFPAPPSKLLTRFQSRIFAIQKNLMQFSGGPDITLGIPDEAFPPDDYFDIPAGARIPTAIAVLNQGNLLAVSNGDTWFCYTGYNAATFTESDKVASPGQAGRWAGCLTPYGYAFLSPSKRLWLWDGQSNPLELSAKMQTTLLGTLAMEDLDSAYIPYARLHWYSQGANHFLQLIARTTSADDTAGTAPTLDWMPLWSTPSDGMSANALFATDKFPLDYPTASADLLLQGVPYIMLGQSGGTVMRYPNTFTDNGVGYDSQFSHAWMAPIDGDTRFFWIDIIVECSDYQAALDLGGPKTFMAVSAKVLQAPENSPRGVAATLLSLVPLPCPRPNAFSEFAMRATMQVPEVNTGKWVRVNVTLAKNSAQLPFDVSVQKISVFYAPKTLGAP